MDKKRKQDLVILIFCSLGLVGMGILSLGYPLCSGIFLGIAIVTMLLFSFGK
jgi:hypothetical protein